MTECNDNIAREKMFTQHMQTESQCVPPLSKLAYSSFKTIKIKKISTDATTPTRSNLSDAGWDLYSSQDTRYIQPGHRVLVKTGIAMEIPEGFAGLIWPRSGLAVKNGIDVFAGVVDAGYRGDVGVCLFNSSAQEVQIKQGDRIAQILFQSIPQFRIVEATELTDTNRGSGGFGSTGK